jgi:sugar phosphate isomerase/epimerase
MIPKLAMGNIFPDHETLKGFARSYGFSGIECSFDLETLPRTPLDESEWLKQIAVLRPIEVRFHCPFYQVDLGHDDVNEAKFADTLFRHIIRLVAKAEGKYLTLHVGLGHNSTETLSWERTLRNLQSLVHYGMERSVVVCLENLAWGWTSRPPLFEKLIRKSGAGVTFDIGHAYACESVVSRHYRIEDFVAPHAHRVFNAHVYHTEISGLGHVPPQGPDDMRSRLSILEEIRCPWWLIEIKEPEALVYTKRIIDAYLEEREARAGEEPESAVIL